MACTNNCTAVYCTALRCAALHCIAQVATEHGALTLGGISQCPSYLSGMTKADVQKEFKKEIDVFVPEKMDFQLWEVRIGTYNILTVGRNIWLNLVSQYYKHIEEMEWAIEEFLKTDLPVASTPVTHD
jgi:betaine-homocysteine S-methyltransferase